MKVEVYDDIACPWCRLGSHQFHRASAGMDVELIHHPYQLMPDAPDTPRPLTDTVVELFGPTQAESMLEGMTELGATEGIEYRFDRAIAVNTLTAHRLRWFALNEHGPTAQAALATALYDAFFRDGVNIADHAQLTELAEQVGVTGTRDFLASAKGTTEVREQVAAAKQKGITTVPRFVFDNGELIIGATSTETLRDALRKASGR